MAPERSFPYDPDEYPNINIIVATEGLVDDEAAPEIAALIEQAALATLLQADTTDAALSVVLIHDESMRELNLDYRGVDAPTDVLSFAAQDDEMEFDEIPDDLAAELDAELGDIFIAVPYAQRQAERFGNSFEAELMLLTVHGVLHLLGYDHATPEDEAAMWALQEEILRPLGVVGLSLRAHDE